MYPLTATIFVAILSCCLLKVTEQQYTPDWTSIDSRPLPT
ncbi:unnamed protein product, partial [Adineta steineri]